MMIDPRKLPNSSITELILATPLTSDLLLVFQQLGLFSQWNRSKFLFPFSSRCRKSIKEIIVSVFHCRDDPGQQMSVCFTISITTFDLEQITARAQSRPSHVGIGVQVITLLPVRVQYVLYCIIFFQVIFIFPYSGFYTYMFDCSISPSWHKTVQFGWLKGVVSGVLVVVVVVVQPITVCFRRVTLVEPRIGIAATCHGKLLINLIIRQKSLIFSI